MNLQVASTDLGEVKKQYLLERLDNLYKTGVIKSEAEYKKLLAEIELAPLTSPSTVLRKQSDLTDPNKINQSFQELTIDLNVLFREVDTIDQSINRQLRLNQSAVENMTMELKALKEEADKVANLLDNSGQRTSYKESFRDNSSLDSNPALMLDRDGSTVLSPVYIDPEFECVKLPLVDETNCLVNSIGQSTASIKILRQVGGAMAEKENPEYSLEKAIDTSPDTYWYQSILADEPLKVPFGPPGYAINEGTALIIEITMDVAQTVNQLSFKPFTRFPIDIISIMAFGTDDPKEVPITIVSPFQETDDLKSVSIREPHVYYFPDLMIKRLWIILCQRHYVERDIILSSREEAKKHSLLNPVNIVPNSGTINFANYETMCEEIPLFPAFLKATSQMQKDIDAILEAETKDVRIPVVKYQYELGFYDIGIKYNQFAQSACYVSKPIPQGGVVREASIEVNEKIPVLFNQELQDFKLANIEYFIGSDQVFYPVVPVNKDVIYNELLVMKYYTVRGLPVFGAKTHAEYDRILAVRQNSMPLKVNEEYVVNNGIIIINNWKFNTIYTVDYIPTENAKSVKFSLSGETITETFNGTDGAGKIQLSQYHFVERAALLRKLGTSWDPSILSSDLVPAVVTIRMPNGEIISQPLNEEEEPRLVNKSDYYSGTRALETFDGEHYQYHIYGKELQFNTPLPKDCTITVSYSYLLDSIRVKAILRRIIPDQFGITPLINDYTLLTKLME